MYKYGIHIYLPIYTDVQRCYSRCTKYTCDLAHLFVHFDFDLIASFLFAAGEEDTVKVFGRWMKHASSPIGRNN